MTSITTIGVRLASECTRRLQLDASTHPPNTAATCTDDGDPCTADICEAGECTHPDRDCEDEIPADACTTDIYCEPWVGCKRDWSCDDGDPCTIDTCVQPEGTCTHEAMWGPVDPPSKGCSAQGCMIDVGVPDFVPMNNDDDDGNGWPDYGDPGPMPEEDDLVPVSLEFTGCGTPTKSCVNTHWHILASAAWPFRFYLTSDKQDLGLVPLPPPASVYLEGRGGLEWRAACGYRATVHLMDLRLYPNTKECCREYTPPVPVVKVRKLEWMKAAPDNEDLSGCPNNGGLRIFPGKLSPTDPSPMTRRKVKLVATIEPPIADVPVYFRVWDVDDPFEQIYADYADPDEIWNVNQIDNDTTGPDNRGSDPAVGSYSATTDEYGIARVTITVSMQPGNNYRAGASCLQDALDQAGQAGADALSATLDQETGRFTRNGNFSGYKVPVVWSKMLTVWRKLHVEIDSMDEEPTTLEARKPDWDEFDAITVSSGSVTTWFNGKGVSLGGALAAEEVDHYEGGSLAYTTPARTFFVLQNYSYHDSVMGTCTKIHTEGTVSPVEEGDILLSLGIVRDDDPISGQLPFFYPLNQDTFIRNAYRHAYIEIQELEAQFNPDRIVAFDLHLTDSELEWGVGYENAQNVWSSANYWAALLVLCYQGGQDIGPGLDWDPDPYTGSGNSGPASNPNQELGGDMGVTPEDDDNASVIFVEAQRDVGAAAGKDYPHTIAHEIGHSCGPNIPGAVEHEEYGIMEEGAPIHKNAFSGYTIVRFRSHTKW